MKEKPREEKNNTDKPSDGKVADKLGQNCYLQPFKIPN